LQGNNGPGVITRVLQKLCDTVDVPKMIAMKHCKTFKVLPIESCYSVGWPEYIKFFKEEFLSETMSRLNESLITHVWNKYSAGTKLNLEANVAYIHLAKKYCPKVVRTSDVF
jgi:lactosylceramide 4-alpha-galactosyltransferase